MRRAFEFLILIALCPAPAQAAERYYVVFYGAQDGRNAPRHSHTWAVFLHVASEDSAGENARQQAESFAISWLPANGDVRLLARPELGRNFTHAESVAWAARVGVAVTYWGPFELTKQGYDLALQQKGRLESGGVLYKALDGRLRPGEATNCIHAVTDIVPGSLELTGSSRGNQGTLAAVQHFRPLLIEPNQVHPEILKLINGSPIAAIAAP